VLDTRPEPAPTSDTPPPPVPWAPPVSARVTALDLRVAESAFKELRATPHVFSSWVLIHRLGVLVVLTRLGVMIHIRVPRVSSLNHSVVGATGVIRGMREAGRGLVLGGRERLRVSVRRPPISLVLVDPGAGRGQVFFPSAGGAAAYGMCKRRFGLHGYRFEQDSWFAGGSSSAAVCDRAVFSRFF